jgi:hypothetical protein
MPQRRPPKAELADIAEHIVAGGHGAVLDPGNQIVEGALAHRVLDAAMPGRANSALDQQTRGAGSLGATAVILLKPERHAEIRSFVERHHRDPDLAGQLGKYGVYIIRSCIGRGHNARNVAIKGVRVDAEPGIDVIVDMPRVRVTRNRRSNWAAR